MGDDMAVRDDVWGRPRERQVGACWGRDGTRAAVAGTVEHDHMKVHMQIAGTPEALDKRD